MPQLKTAILYQFGLQKLWDFKVDCLGHNLYLFCTMSTCLSFFQNMSHANYLGKYTKGKNLIWVTRSFHERTFIWDSFDSNRYFLRAFKYFFCINITILQIHECENVSHMELLKTNSKTTESVRLLCRLLNT